MSFQCNRIFDWNVSIKLLASVASALLPVLAFAESGGNIPPSGATKVTKTNEQVQMVINSSHMLTLEDDIERASVHNDALLTVRPMARNELLVSAKATGVTQVDLYAPNKQIYSVQVVVLGDARELEAILRAEFPMAALQVRPIQSAVVISGQVTSDEHVEQVVAIAEQYYPTVINRIEVIGVHTIMLHTQVMEVSRTKLRQLGIDWAADFGTDTISQSIAGTLSAPVEGVRTTANDTMRFGIVDNGNGFFAAIRALQDRNLVKLMADPTVVALDGRPASFNSGGEFPILIPAGNGVVGVDFREFGTRLDFVAKVRGDGRIWLEVRPTISEIDSARGVNIDGTSIPGLRSRFVETAVELRAGQTLALAGLLQTRTESQSTGIPGLCDLPFIGAIFRSNREVQNEIELLITVTPDFAAAMDPQEVPRGGPGYNSYNPTDKELYWRGYLETPSPCPPVGNSGSEQPCIGTTNTQPIQLGMPTQSNSLMQGAPVSQPAPPAISIDPAAYRISNGTPAPGSPNVGIITR
jgi:pilus assembly protein CpaC